MGSLEEAPLVELTDAFEGDEFVCPPPESASKKTISLPGVTTRRRTNHQPINNSPLNQPQSSQDTRHDGEPVSYTPHHPSLQPSPTRQQWLPTNSRYPRRAHNGSLSANNSTNLVGSTTPSILNQNQQDNVTQSSSAQADLPTSSSLTTSVINLPEQQPHPAGSGWRFQPRFGGGPHFTTYENGRPQATSVQQPVPEWRNTINSRSLLGAYTRPLEPRMIRSKNQMRHINHQSRGVAPPMAHSNNVPPTLPPPRMPQSSIPNFPQQATNVRPAYEDFLRHVQVALPGVNVNDLLNQIINRPTQPLQIPVPNGINAALIQEQLQRTLEASMIQALNQTNQTKHANVPRPPPPKNSAIPPQMRMASLSDFSVSPSGILVDHYGRPLIPGVDHSSIPQAAGPPPPPPPSEDDMAKQDQDADVQDEEYREVATYSDYAPSKLTIGKPHPDPVVETSSLSTVEPPDIEYNLKLPPKVIENGLLSALQLESVIYACQQHSKLLPDRKTRRGFLIGDGAGVGKGRTIAGIIYENYLCGRKKSIWLSVSPDLKFDAERDLKDIGASRIPVFTLGKFPYGKRINMEAGVIFTTYTGLVSKSQSVKGTLGTRLGQLVTWLGIDFEGVIVFDECHKAKNISLSAKKKQSKTADFALDLQKKLPRARVVYASATGASETKHLGYMTRLGIWGEGTPYPDFTLFCNAIEKRGVGAMELVAVDLKMRGSYIARQLSFKTTSFEIRVACLDESFVEVYDQCCELWAKALYFFNKAADYFHDEKKRTRTIWSSFWGAHQKFFKYLCIGAKVSVVVQIAQEALKNNKCVVIGLQSTGEARTMEALEEGDLNEFISTARATFESLVENHFPAPHSPRSDTKSEKSPSNPSLSSHSSVNENWHDHGAVKFVIEDDGVVNAELEPTKAHAKLTRSSRLKREFVKEISKNQKVLQELAEQKRATEGTSKKSSRSLRARRRAGERDKKKSRIRLLEEDSDETVSSNPLSSVSGIVPSSPSNHNSDTDTTYSSESGGSTSESEETIVESGQESNGDSSASNPKRRRPDCAQGSSKMGLLDSDSDSDIVITAVKPSNLSARKKNCEIIFLSSDDEEEDETSNPNDPMNRYGAQLITMKREMLSMIEQLGPKLPNNTLDDLIDRLGGPSKVAEMTGRKGRLVKDEEGKVSYRARNEDDALENLNIAEKERFMSGQKYIAIISEAASSGISLQADRRVANTRRRVHITIELPWSADRAIQQFGRTHRSNQLSGPEYVFVISELAGEKRFASIVAKRLESLGALTHGDRRATTESRDLSQFNIASRFCKQALELICRLLECNVKFADIRPEYDGEFILDAREAFVGSGLARKVGDLFLPEAAALQINHFLNRLLGMKVRIQNALFKLFTDYMERLIARKKVAGLFDSGILELNSESGKTHCSEPEDFYLKTKSDVVKCTLRNVQVERGLSWEAAVELLESDKDERSGFYVSTNPLTKAKMVFLILREQGSVDLFRPYKPNTGRQAKPEDISLLTAKSEKSSRYIAERIWRRIFESTDTQCIHLCFFNSCKRMEAKMKCDVGLRHRNYCILSGGILTAWPYLEKKAPEVTQKLQIVRLKLDSSNRVIGPIIPQDSVEHVRRVLRNGEQGLDF